MNAEITYCYNFWLMHENPSEIAIHMKRLSSKVVGPEKISVKLLRLVAGNSFFQGTMFHYFTKIATSIHCSMDAVSFRRALAAMNCVYTMYLKGIEFILNSSCSHPFDE